MSHELENIPFYWTALAHWVMLLLCSAFHARPMALWQRIILSAVSLGALAGVMYATEPLHGMAFNAMMFCFALLTVLVLGLLSNMGPIRTMYSATRCFIYAGFTASLMWQLYIYFDQRNNALHPLWAELLFGLNLYALVSGVIFLLELHWVAAADEVHLSLASVTSTVVTAVVIYILSSISFAPFETPFGGSTYAEAFNLRTMVYLGGAAVLFAHHVALCDAYVVLERDTLKNMLSTQYLNYRLSQESVDLVNQKYHDLKHQIALLRAEAGRGNGLEYLDRMEREIASYEAQNKTGNQVLDTILTGKSLHCQKEGISFTCVADGAALDFVDAMDMSALFGNAIDNAIEAVSNLPEEERLIHLSVSREKGFVRIRLENRFQGDLRLNRGLPVTTKHDKRYHGFGVKSIAATAERYGGSATFDQKNGWFELRILLPLTE